MNTLIERDVIKFLIKSRETIHLINSFNPKIFLLQESQTVYEVFRAYVEKYNSLPSEHGLKFYLERESDFEPEFLEFLNTAISKYFEPLEDEQLIKETVIKICQQSMLKKSITDLAPKIDEIQDKDIERIIGELQGIGQITKSRENKTVTLRDVLIDEDVISHPTIYPSLNKFTASGGFYSPQLIVLVAQPKSFKTGTLLNMALGYARQGLKVFWADFENGLKPMINRSKQNLLECSFKELMTSHALFTENDISLNTCLDMQLDWINRLGGDFRIGYYPAKITTLDEVEKDIDEFGPDVIFWDYLDLAAIDDKKKDVRLTVQEVYHGVVRINVKHNCFSFTPSQINRGGTRKKRIKPEDIAEDYGKFMNAHALFALNREDEEDDEIYVSVLAQRDGVKHGEFRILVNEETQQAIEL